LKGLDRFLVALGKEFLVAGGGLSPRFGGVPVGVFKRVEGNLVARKLASTAASPAIGSARKPSVFPVFQD
jgi:hypothetical protein